MSPWSGDFPTAQGGNGMLQKSSADNSNLLGGHQGAKACSASRVVKVLLKGRGYSFPWGEFPGPVLGLSKHSLMPKM